MVTPKAKEESYTLPWEFVPRLATHHFGSEKYSTSTKALRELVANALDAEASTVEVTLNENNIGGLSSVVIRDNGRGITPEDLRDRFVRIGVAPTHPSDSPSHLGRFGVGRLAVHRIGTTSRWTSVSVKDNGERVRLHFDLHSHGLDQLKVSQQLVTQSEPLGTTVEIVNLRDDANDKLTPGRIRVDLLIQFCSFLLGHSNCKIIVQDEQLNVESIIEYKEETSIDIQKGFNAEATVTHLLLKRPVDQSRFPGQLLFAANGCTVATVQPSNPPTPQYLGVVECPYLNSIVTADREALVEIDEGFAILKRAVIESMEAFGERMKTRLSREFIERAREEAFYPFRAAPSDAVANVEQAVYDVVLEKLNETTNLEGMTKRQQEVVFRLLRRTLENEDLLEVLEEVAKLSDEDMERFRRVLERTTLDCIIKLSSEVTSRLAFLDVLHQLVYGDVAKHLKERTQLHRILEPNCWIFGPRFHLAASDQQFRRVIEEHRRMAQLPALDQSTVMNIAGITDVPDLFLAATREYPVEPANHHLLVELKAPSVLLGSKERDQVRRYARTIRDSQQFDKQSTRWDLYLVSARVNPEIEDDRNQKDKPHGVLWEWEDMTVWAITWSEIIECVRQELQLVRQHLRQKSQELSVRDYLRQSFPEILETLA